MNKIYIFLCIMAIALFIEAFFLMLQFFDGLDVMRTVSFEGVEHILVFTYTITYFSLIFAGMLSLLAVCILLYVKIEQLIEYLKEPPV